MSSATPVHTDADDSARAARAAKAVRRAWWSLLLCPVAVVGAFAVGEGIAGHLGVTDRSATLGEAAVVLAAALAVLALPLALTARFGATAARLGRPDGWRPTLVAGLLIGGFAALNLLAYLLG